MSSVFDPLQKKVLDYCDDWSNSLPGVRAVYVFGSVDRGDYREDSDIDLYIDIDASTPAECSRSLNSIASLQTDLGKESGRKISVHYDPFGEGTDDATKAIQHSQAKTVASQRKVHLISAPRA